MSSPSPARAPSVRPSELVDALRRVGTIVLFGALPLAALVTMLAVGLSDDSLSADFHHEIYPQAKEMLDGGNPYPAAGYDPTAGPNFIWPPLVAYLAAPLTLLPAGAADVVMVVLGLLCMAAALWLVGARDWRVYGVLGLWPEVVGEMRVAHLTPVVALLVAAAWRYRDVRGAPGPLVGLAVALKFFVWPVALWLAATRRSREAVLAALVAGVSLLLVLPFMGLEDYAHRLTRLGRAFDQDSYTLYGLLVQAGAPDGVARGLTVALGAALLAAMWRYRSFTLAVAAALALSPIVWLDYFALAALPLAIARPRLSAIWFLPLVTWGLEGAGLGIGDVSDIARLLLVFTVVLGVAFSHDLAVWRAGATPVSVVRPQAHGAIGRSSGA